MFVFENINKSVGHGILDGMKGEVHQKLFSFCFDVKCVQQKTLIEMLHIP